jgi:hypothetical protein
MTWTERPPDRPDRPDRPERPARLTLVQPEHLVYQGAFRVPAGLGYFGAGLTFCQAHNSLFGADANNNYIAEVGPLPTPVISTTGYLGELPVAPLLQPMTDACCGLLQAIVGDAGTVPQIGGLLVWDDGTLRVGASRYYDANCDGKLSEIRCALDFAHPQADGPYQVGGQGAGSIGGYYGRVPIPWQRPLGGPVLHGWTAPTIVMRTSMGPAAFAINPDEIGVVPPYAPAIPLSFYPYPNGLYDYETRIGQALPLFNSTSHVGGVVVCPAGTRSVLFVGDNGHGPCCYGDVTPTGHCDDPYDTSKGDHTAPYYLQIWAYDALELAAVQRGTTICYDVQPYAYWVFGTPFPSWGRPAALGACDDPVTGRIFMAQKRAGGDDSVIHVYRVAA